MKRRMMVLKAGKPAMHKLGNIGSYPSDTYIDVDSETKDEFIGMFSEGLGLVEVHFKKKDVRPLRRKEIKKLNTQLFTINGEVRYRISLDQKGYYN